MYQKPSMKFISTCLLLLLTYLNTIAAPGRDSLLNALNKAIASSPAYDAQKMNTIRQLRDALSDSAGASPEEKYSIYLQLYNEYKSFTYDSA